MKILHTEASKGWGGQEIRVLTEAEGMLNRGHQIVLIVNPGAQLTARARKLGILIHEVDMTNRFSLKALRQIIHIIRNEKIDIVNTHSSIDAWLGGIAARITGKKVIRTRHLSTPSKPGLNSKILYNWLADVTVTTCESVAQTLRQQVPLSPERCLSIPTGMNPALLQVKDQARQDFRTKWGIKPDECVAGSVCVLRSWKGIIDLIRAAKQLRDMPNLKWLIVGEGPSREWYTRECRELGLGDKIIFTGHIEKPYEALASLDIFLLLSIANEGVSQSSLQAAYLQKPLITTTIGGLAEVCLDGKTGYHVHPGSPNEVSVKVRLLVDNPQLREEMGKRAKDLVVQNFTLEKTLDSMEKVYLLLQKRIKKRAF